MDIEKKIARIIFCIIGFTVFLSSCEYETIEPLDSNVPAVVSFSTHIQPIFTNKCTGCHPTLANLDLSDGNSYNSISNGRINLTTPAESEIYSKPAPAGNHPAKYSTNEADIVLKWIENGATNN